MKKDIINLSSIIPVGIIGVTILTGTVLISNKTNADDVIDQVSVSVPMSCTMSGTGQDSHNANINNGTYTPNIGTTTMHVFCNDNEGFAIYAAGYTGDEIGGENSNKLVGTNVSGNSTIESGLATSAGNPDVSNWAMKLAITQDSGDTTDTNAFVIDSAPNIDLPSEADPGATQASFSDYHIVPNEYVKVAHKNSVTDMTASTGGVKLTTTYAAYISKTQPADTYSGQVKYTLVHPSTAPVPIVGKKINVVYNANGSTFTGGATTNRVTYVAACETEQIEYFLSKSSNVNDDGAQDPSASVQFENDTVQIPGASKLKVEIKYGMQENTGGVWVMEGPFSEYEEPEVVYTLSGNGENTYIFNGDMVTFVVNEFETPSEPNYGYYAKIYPLDSNDEEYTVEETNCNIDIDGGTYTQTVDWYGSWYTDFNNQHYDFTNETEVEDFLGKNGAILSSDTIINIYRSLTINEAYAKANKTQSGGYYTQQDMDNSICQTVAIGQNDTVKDSRDNNTYMIGRLKDGRCWMLDNLALDPTDSTTAANMNANNTNATAEAITNYLNGGSSTTGWSSVAVASSTTSSFGDNESFVQPRINNQSKNTLVTSYGPASNNGQAKVGIYYNYCAAAIGTYCYASYDGIDVPETDIDASQDICPINWRMPTGGDAGEYYILSQKYSSIAGENNSLQKSLSTPLSGSYSSYDDGGRNSLGFFWSSTCYSGANSYYIGINVYRLFISDMAVGADKDSHSGRNAGYPIRCLVNN